MLVQRSAVYDNSPHLTVLRCLFHSVRATYTTVNIFLMTWARSLVVRVRNLVKHLLLQCMCADHGFDQ